MQKGKAMTSEAWESWRTQFRKRLMDELDRRGMAQKELAHGLGFQTPSSLSYHMSGKGPNLEFVESIERMFPERFSGAAIEFVAAKTGISPTKSLSHLHRDEILLALDSVEQAFGLLREAVTRFAVGREDDETPGPSTSDRDCDGH